MKKRLIIIIAVLIVAVFTGCGSKDSEVTGDDSTNLAVRTTPTSSDENLSRKEGEERTTGDDLKDLEVPKKTDSAVNADNSDKATSDSKLDGSNKAVNSTKPDSGAKPASSSKADSVNKAASSSKPASTSKPKADEKRPDGNATLAGEVVSVNGRKVSLKIVKIPGLGGNGS